MAIRNNNNHKRISIYNYGSFNSDNSFTRMTKIKKAYFLNEMCYSLKNHIEYYEQSGKFKFKSKFAHEYSIYNHLANYLEIPYWTLIQNLEYIYPELYEHYIKYGDKNYDSFEQYNLINKLIKENDFELIISDTLSIIEYLTETIWNIERDIEIDINLVNGMRKYLETVYDKSSEHIYIDDVYINMLFNVVLNKDDLNISKESIINTLKTILHDFIRMELIK